MGTQVLGAGASRIIPDDMIPERISNNIMIHGAICNLTPNIALADADFEGNLICGDKVKWFVDDHTDDSMLQSVQGNEEPETTTFSLCSESAEICGMNKFKIKLSNDNIRKLECAGLKDMYVERLEKKVNTTIENSWDNSHVAYLLQMADPRNVGNNALNLGINLGSPDNPIVLSKTDGDANAIRLNMLFKNLYTVIGEQQGECGDGDNALVMTNLVASDALEIFKDLNTCCGEDNVRVTGNLPSTILGFDPFKTTKKVMTVRYRGNTLHYIIAVDKNASGFVSDTYGFEWHKEAFDWFLVGTEVHGSYVLKPEHVAVAVVTFE